jgi:CheY-like chemotaxis protein
MSVSSASAVVAQLYGLLVSSDPETVKLLTAALQRLATSTIVSDDTSAALNLLNKRKFEAIVVDLTQDQEAKAVLEHARSSPSNRTTVTFAVIQNERERKIAFAAGSNFVLRKPLVPDSVDRTLNAAYGLIMRERRRYFRCPTAIPVCVQGAVLDRDVLCQIMNISEGGMAIASPGQLRPGVQVIAKFVLPGQTEDYVAECEICWCDENGRAGLRFLSLSSERKAALQSWLSHKLEETLLETVTNRFRGSTGSG